LMKMKWSKYCDEWGIADNIEFIMLLGIDQSDQDCIYEQCKAISMGWAWINTVT